MSKNNYKGSKSSKQSGEDENDKNRDNGKRMRTRSLENPPTTSALAKKKVSTKRGDSTTKEVQKLEDGDSVSSCASKISSKDQDTTARDLREENGNFEAASSSGLSNKGPLPKTSSPKPNEFIEDDVEEIDRSGDLSERENDEYRPRQERFIPPPSASYSTPPQTIRFPRPAPPPPPQHQMQNAEYYSAGSFAPFDMPSSNSYQQYYQQKINLFPSPPMHGAGYFYPRNPAAFQFPYPLGYGMTEYSPYAGGVPQQPFQRGYPNVDPLASLLALQQSIMVTQVQKAMLSNATANAATSAEYVQEQAVIKKKEEQTVNVKNIHRDVHKMLEEVLEKHGIKKKNKGNFKGGRGAKGGRGNRGGGGGRGGGRGGSGGGRGDWNGGRRGGYGGAGISA